MEGLCYVCIMVVFCVRGIIQYLFIFRRFCRGFVGRQGFQCQGIAYIAVSDFEEAVFGDRNLDIISLLFCQGKVAVNCL